MFAPVPAKHHVLNQHHKFRPGMKIVAARDEQNQSETASGWRDKWTKPFSGTWSVYIRRMAGVPAFRHALLSFPSHADAQ